MSPSPAETSSLLADVRKSYRLLHDYQRLILDSLKYVGNQLDIPYCAGWTVFSDGQPRNGKGVLDNWAWDWLGMYAYEFRFDYSHLNPRGIPVKEGEHIGFSATVFPDTGFYEGKEAGKTDSSTFKSPETSSSIVLFSFFKGPWTPLHTLYTQEELSQLIREEEWTRNIDECPVWGMTRNISDLFDQVSADRLIDDLARFAHSHELPIYKSGLAPHELAQENPMNTTT
ncbi:MAG: hypothetical protein ACSHX9_00045 [Luteolibacter sp.]